MTLPSLPLVVLDTETTGFVPRTHKVIEFASIEVRGGKVKTEYEQLFKHESVPPLVEVLTRIRTADLKDKPLIADHRQTILRHLPEDALLVGQNIPFDIGMLRGEEIDLTGRPFIDTSILASLVFPELESYSLGYLSTVLELNHNPPHRALGDVRATLELLAKCWERLLEIPEDLRDLADAIMERGPAGYKTLFAALPAPTAKKEPGWLSKERRRNGLAGTLSPVPSVVPEKGPPALMDEPLDALHLQAVIEGALKDSSVRHWIAVKSLRPVLRRMPEALTKKIRVLYPPHALIDVDAVLRFSKQESYTADEAMLALKIAWYEPSRRDELPMHGGEEAVWNGKISCTATSKAYLDQFADMPGVVLLEHRELLEFLQTPDHPAAKAMASASHVIVDDASMLEDTATRAYGWYCAMDDVRAAAQGNDLMTRFVDTLQLWVEKTRQFQDIRYLTQSDLGSMESKGLRTLIDDVLKQEWPAQLLRHLEDLRRILQPENLSHRIAWIEQKPNGNQMLQSVPERIGQLLGETLFKRIPTTLLIPQGSAHMLPEILPVSGVGLRVTGEASDDTQPATRNQMSVSFDPRPALDELLTSPLPGKTIILLPGKSAIEDLYVKYTEALEVKNVTLICQGLNGGMGRMQAEFLAADAPAVWLITPWMFEGVDLPEGTVNHFIIKALPFDHPSHPVLGRRSQLYRDAFNDYSLPRLMHRLFRLLRTYARIRTADGDVRILDDRLTTKAYGKTVRGYLEQFASGKEFHGDNKLQPSAAAAFTTAPLTSVPTLKDTPAKPAAKRKKPAKDQPSLF